MPRRLPGPTPAEVVELLDQYVVGQAAAKRAIAVALRNRTRRKAVEGPMRDEIMPKNLLFIGPTGVGKTEIARRVAQMVDAPFSKVEATKFSEIGYVGRDVEGMVRDLVDVARLREVAKAQRGVEVQARELVARQLVDALAGVSPWAPEAGPELLERRETLRRQLDAGALEEYPVTLQLPDSGGGGRMDVLSGAGMEEISIQLRNMMPGGGRLVTRTLPVSEARRRLLEDRLGDLIDEEQVNRVALRKAEEDGVIFLDELDKVALPEGKKGGSGPDVSREGVQRDLLPVVEGSTVRTKYGAIRTDHILFVAAGSFHGAKVTDLIPELLGRFPIRVRLRPLEAADLKRILIEPRNSLLRQYEALLETEGVDLEVTDDAAEAMAAFATRANQGAGNLGARRLHAVIERVLEDLLYLAPDEAPERIVIDAAYVEARLAGKPAADGGADLGGEA